MTHQLRVAEGTDVILEVTKSDTSTAGHVVAGLARVPELRRGADGVRRPLRRRLLEHQQGTRLRLLPAALRKRHAGERALHLGGLFQNLK